MSPDRARFSIGLIGAGRMGKAHLDAIEGSSTVVVSAVVDPSPEAREVALQRDIPAFASIDDLLNEGIVDGVLIAAPTDLHRALVEQAANARVPILCEKPCGLSSDDARACVRATSRWGVPLQIAYWRRYVLELQQLRDRIRSGELGEVLAVQSEQWDEFPPSAAFRARSGGIFVDMGVHEFDQIRWLTGREFEALKAIVSRPEMEAPISSDVDCGQVLASLSNGGTAHVSLGRWHDGGDTCVVEVFGTRGTARSRFLPADGSDGVFKQALRRQAEDFVRFANGSSSLGATGADGVIALSLAEQAGKDAGC